MADSLLLQRDILLAIQQRRKQKGTEVAKTRDLIKTTFNQIVNPIPRAATRAQRVSHLVSNAMAVWQGISLGIKIVRGVRHTFRK